MQSDSEGTDDRTYDDRILLHTPVVRSLCEADDVICMLKSSLTSFLCAASSDTAQLLTGATNGEAVICAQHGV